jgi:hypothetical protein
MFASAAPCWAMMTCALVNRATYFLIHSSFVLYLIRHISTTLQLTNTVKKSSQKKKICIMRIYEPTCFCFVDVLMKKRRKRNYDTNNLSGRNFHSLMKKRGEGGGSKKTCFSSHSFTCSINVKSSNITFTTRSSPNFNTRASFNSL